MTREPETQDLLDEDEPHTEFVPYRPHPRPDPNPTVVSGPAPSGRDTQIHPMSHVLQGQIHDRLVSIDVSSDRTARAQERTATASEALLEMLRWSLLALGLTSGFGMVAGLGTACVYLLLRG